MASMLPPKDEIFRHEKGLALLPVEIRFAFIWALLPNEAAETAG